VDITAENAAFLQAIETMQQSSADAMSEIDSDGSGCAAPVCSSTSRALALTLMKHFLHMAHHHAAAFPLWSGRCQASVSSSACLPSSFGPKGHRASSPASSFRRRFTTLTATGVTRDV